MVCSTRPKASSYHLRLTRPADGAWQGHDDTSALVEMRPRAASCTPALVLGGPSATALAVIRSLGRAGIPQYAVGTIGSFVARSRWHRPLPPVSGGTPAATELGPLLAALPLERAVLFPCTDEWALAVASLDGTWAGRFPISSPPRASVETLVDKVLFSKRLLELGIAHPRTLPLHSADELTDLPESALAGTFLKPRHSQVFARRYGVKAFRFRTRAEAVMLARRASDAGIELMLQEYVPGPPARHYMIEGFVDRSGQISVRFARQRVRMEPPDFGDSTCMVTIALDAVRDAIEPLDRLLAALRYRGMFEAEFKLDDRDGRFKLLEVNARPWMFLGFAAVCGVDFCGMAYQDALGLPVVPVHRYAVGRRFIIPYLDAFSCWRLIREHRLTLWDWARSWIGAGHLVFAWDDPEPAFGSAVQQLREIFQSAWRRVPNAWARTRQ